MIRCTQCRRPLLNEPVRIGEMTLGPKCAQDLGYGRSTTLRQHRFAVRRSRPADRQVELFGASA